MWSQSQGYKALSTVSIGFLRQGQQFTPPAVRPTQHKECVMVTGMFTAAADFQRHSNTARLRLASDVRALVGVLDAGHMQSSERRWINAINATTERLLLRFIMNRNLVCFKPETYILQFRSVAFIFLVGCPPDFIYVLWQLDFSGHLSESLLHWSLDFEAPSPAFAFDQELMCFNLRGSLRLFPLCFLSYAQWVPGPHPAQDAEPFVSGFHVAPGSSEGQNTRTHNQTQRKI